ncbi:MAG: diaminopimelate epimerase [Candidatus Omnitrophota bacterium]
MNDLNFVKVVASGNDFVLLDHYQKKAATDRRSLSTLAKTLCQRKLSVGADGLLVVERSSQADFKMRIFNPDGREVDMCGNGSRCVALYAFNRKIVAKRVMSIETRAGILQAEVKAGAIKVKMSPPKDLHLKFDLNLGGRSYNVSYVNTGVPHVVCFVRGLDKCDVAAVGRQIRYHSEFLPEGTNADFVEVLSKTHIRIRTYERGVEEETLACGTGSVAAAIITVLNMYKESGCAKFRVRVDTKSGECLLVYFSLGNAVINDVYLQGEARIVFAGALRIL